jgi:GNAT superfamily N-acetyltransferase
MVEFVLDNPMWASLTTTHADLAIGGGAVRQYPADVIAGMCALRDTSPASFAALAERIGAEGRAALFLSAPDVVPQGWTVLYARDIAQMVFDGAMAPPEIATEPLGLADVGETQALVELTKPGPFSARTVILGDYRGVRIDGRLVAMAGVRLRPAGFSEISAVCVHPGTQGRGLGRVVTQAVGAVISARGEGAFLHVKTDNAAALRTYDKMGFRKRRTIYLRVVRPG